MNLQLQHIPVLILLLTAPCLPARAQLNLPQPSPEGKIIQRVGFTDITVSYSRPSAKGRQIFGGVVPFGTLWRTGASDATTIGFNQPVRIAGQIIPAGKYSLFTITNASEWTIILNKDTTLHGTSDYQDSLDVVRFKVKPGKAPRFQETFTIEVADIVKDAATLFLIWENTEASFPIVTSADQQVLDEINRKMQVDKDVRPGLYYQSALYYYDNDKDLKQAQAWIDRAVGKEADFRYLHLQAKIRAKLRDYAGAIASAQQSAKLAQEQKFTDYVKLNEQLIAQWRKQR